MTFFLRIVDHTGRGYKSLLPFDTEAEREAHARENFKGDDATDEEIDDLIASLEAGSSVEFEHTEYEFLNS